MTIVTGRERLGGRMRSRNGPTAASVYATSPSYGASRCAAANGAGGAYGECGSNRWIQAKNGCEWFASIHTAADRITSSADRSVTPGDVRNSSSYRSNPRGSPDDARSG